ncbi:FAD-binding oxidoreductase [Williamsia maris]|uniref:nitric oxide dioxygenase n=1 Tax=Williamsia maris TaxID=72806 RepID=A0ABT1HE61_9NOCA|nr:FAD-binding oxidoreductase [Williamsia maris]MCP2176541.1 NAD(P)H-flavin reductase [Williamsia maris]
MGSHTRNGLAAVRGAIGRDPDRFVSNFYTRLFSVRPDLRDLFPATMAHQRAALFGVLDHIFEVIPDPAGHTDLIGFLGQLGHDHRKYGVSPEDYDVFFRSLLAEISSTLGEDFDPATSAITAQALLLATGVMRGAAESARGPATWQARVVEKYRLSRDLAVVRLVTDTPLTYMAGQYLEIQIPQWPRFWRHLSPSIPPNPSGELEFHVRAVPSGTVSASIVTETAVGDVWTLAQSHGTLAVEPDRDVVLLAGGTGLAPLRSLIIEMSRRVDSRPTHLFYGMRYPGELYDVGTLAQIAGTNPWLTVTVASEETTNPWWLTRDIDFARLGMEHRIGTVAEVALAHGDWSEHQAIVAGSPEMVENTRRSLIIAGVPARRIQSDPL